MTKPVTFTLREPYTCDTSDAQWRERHPDTMRQQARLRKKLADKMTNCTIAKGS